MGGEHRHRRDGMEERAEGAEAFAAPMTESLEGEIKEKLEGLSARQREVLQLIGWGLKVSEIAERLQLSPKTVDSHRLELGRKLGVRNRVELARIAISAGLTPIRGGSQSLEDELRREIAHRKRAQDALHTIDAGAGAATGIYFFHSLVQQLATTLGARAAWVGRALSGEPGRIETIAAWCDQRPGKDFSYVPGPLCREVIERGMVYRAKLEAHDGCCPPGFPFAQPQAFLGARLNDSAGLALGVLMLLHDQPLDESLEPDLIVRIYAGRAGAELLRLQTEEALRDSEQRYRLMAENSSDLITCHSAGGDYLYASAACRQLTGYEPHELVGRNAYEFFHPQDLEAISRTHGQVLSRPGVFTVEYRYRRRDGSFTWFETTCRTVAETDHPGGTQIVAVTRDVTSRKVVEEALQRAHNELEQRVEQRTAELERANAALRERDRQLSTLMANLPGMVYRCRNDPQWTLEFVSHGCLRLTGHPPDHLLNNAQLSFAQLIVPEDRQRIWDEVQQAIGLRKPFTLHYRICRADGVVRDVWEQGRGVFDTRGRLIALEGFITDVSDRAPSSET